MEVLIERENKKVKSEARTVGELLKNLKINSTTVIVSANDELVTEDYKLNKKDKIKIMSVISCG